MTSPVGVVALDEPQRQSLMAVVFLAFRTVRQIGLVQIVIAIGFAVSQSPSVAFLFVIVPLVALVFLGIAGLSWWRYTFRLVGGELQVDRGVLSTQTLSVPLDRVQSVSLEQKLLHRPFGLVQVSLETAGTDTAEFTIDAVEREVAHALQRAAADHRPAVPVDELELDASGTVVPPAPAPPDEVLIVHSPKRLITVALTQTPLSGFALLAPLIAVGDQVGDLIPFDLPTIDGASFGAWLVWAIPLGLLVALVASAVLNLIRVLLSDWNLTVTSTVAGLRRESGLLSTTSVASSIPRIQRITVSQGVLERMAGLHTVVLHTIGSGDFAIPGCDVAQVDQIRRIVSEETDGAPARDRVVSQAEIFKAVRDTSIGAVLLVAALAVPLGWWSMLAFISIPIVWLTTRRQTRLRRWGLTAEALSDRQQLFKWTQQDLLFRKANGARVSQSLFERKRGLATVTIQTADGSISIGMVGIAEARALRDRALFVAETDRHAWM